MKKEVVNSIGVFEEIVRQEHTAVLDGCTIHPVYSTFWLAYHTEAASRRAIEPYFDEGENAVGAAISLRHIAMAGIGENIKIQAKVKKISGAKIICKITVTASERVIALGTQTQIVMPQSRIDVLIREANFSALSIEAPK
ncbi:hypothetical protein MASR2M18_06030 [Ignavibacteria bacterium]|jgi:predicted thioesterase|nr:thioesterase [Bacteroidota bacterium]